MVLDRPETPLNTNGSENDIRSQVTRRKVSVGTRSDQGRDCRDAFLGLVKTCAKLGVVCVPINLGWRPNEVAYVLGHSGARGIVLESQLAEAIAPALADSPEVTDVVIAPGTGPGAAPGGDLAGRAAVSFAQLADGAPADEPLCYVADRDPISYLYTSGTTSFPKGVVGNHTAIYLESMSMALEARFNETDRFVAMMPMFHTAQLNCHCTAAVMVGAAIYIERGFSAGRLLELIEAERITQIFGLPMMYREMLEHPDVSRRDLSSLRRALYAIAPMPQEQLERCIETFNCDFYLLFGQTEMSPTTTLFRPEHQLTHNGAAGTPVTNIEVAIMGPDGELLPPGELGEIVYRGPHTMTNYLKDPDATTAAFEHGWFHSGDVGRFDSDGILWFADRYKDVIKTGGENVASIEVEKALYEAEPRIAEVVAVGLPHERWAEAITAIVVPKPGSGLTAADVEAAAKSRLAGFKRPKKVVLVEDMPRTSTGKVQKNILRQTYHDLYRDERA